MSARVPFHDVSEVAASRLCIGCGACVAACPEQKVTLVDFVDHGLRPVVSDGCTGCSDCVTACPGIGISHARTTAPEGGISGLWTSWGPVLEVWEGYASDPDLRFGGSSGGLASALALFCIEQDGMHGVVHIGSDDVVRYRNKTVFSRTRGELLAATGSRYSPASPCDHLRLIERADGPYVFIGKPCDVEGLRKTELLLPQLATNVGVAIAIFCAGTPSTRGTLDLLAKYGINPDDVDEIRYRGRGWPGRFSVRLKHDDAWKDIATYEEAWGFLQAYRPFRCHLCPDGTGEFADISCGDPWYREIEQGESGRSLVVIRTPKGREIVHKAMRAGYVRLEAVEPEVVAMSQRDLQRKRGAIWGRVVTMKALGIPSPKFAGFSLFANWLRIPAGHKLRSIVGTARRILSRRLHRPLELR